MILVRLFFEFFKAGLFAVGGGLATLPFLQEISQKTSYRLQIVRTLQSQEESVVKKLLTLCVNNLVCVWFDQYFEVKTSGDIQH